MISESTPRTMFTGIAKPMPSTPRFLATMAVLIPTSAPLESISAPRVAEVDRGVGLDEVLEGRDAELLAAGCAHDPVSDGMSQPDRIADREYHVPDQKLIRPAEARHRELGEVDLQHREVGVGIPTHDARVRLAPVLELHADRISIGRSEERRVG